MSEQKSQLKTQARLYGASQGFMLNLTLFAFQFGATGGGFGTLAKFKMEKRTLTSLNESSFFHLPHCFLLLSLSVGSLFRGVGSFELHVPCHACTRLTCYEE